MKRKISKLIILASAALTLLAACAGDAVRTPEQAKTIALASVCAQRIANPVANEIVPSEWSAERRGDRWYAWLPIGSGATYAGITKYGHMGAWIDPKTGKIVACENGASHAIGQPAPPVRISAPPVPGSVP